MAKNHEESSEGQLLKLMHEFVSRQISSVAIRPGIFSAWLWRRLHFETLSTLHSSTKPHYILLRSLSHSEVTTTIVQQDHHTVVMERRVKTTEQVLPTPHGDENLT